jgi:hypothetical protein
MILSDFILHTIMIRTALTNQAQLLSANPGSRAQSTSKQKSTRRMVTLFSLLFVADLVVLAVVMTGIAFQFKLSKSYSINESLASNFMLAFPNIVYLPIHTILIIKFLDYFKTEALKRVSIAKRNTANNSPVSFFNYLSSEKDGEDLPVVSPTEDEDKHQHQVGEINH